MNKISEETKKAFGIKDETEIKFANLKKVLIRYIDGTEQTLENTKSIYTFANQIFTTVEFTYLKDDKDISISTAAKNIQEIIIID